MVVVVICTRLEKDILPNPDGSIGIPAAGTPTNHYTASQIFEFLQQITDDK